MTDPTVRERIEAVRRYATRDVYRRSLDKYETMTRDLCDALLASEALGAREQAGSGKAEPTRLVSSPKSTRDNSLGATVPPSPAPAVKMPAFGAAIPDSSKYAPASPAAAGDVEPACIICGAVERTHTHDYSHMFVTAVDFPSPPAPDVARVDYGAIWKEFTRVERGGDSPTGWSGTPFLDLEAMARALSQSRQRAEAAEAENRVTRSRREDADHTLQRQGPLEEELASARAELTALRSSGVEGVVREWATGLAGNRHYRIETNASQTEWPIHTRVHVRKVDP